MKKHSWLGLLAAVALLAGCAQETRPPEDEEAWEVPAATDTGNTDNATAEKSETPAPPADPTLLAAVKGSDFTGENTSGTIHGDIMRVGHYFAAEAPFELKTTATMMESHLEGLNSEGAVPLIGIQAVTTSGKYQSHKEEARPIDGEQHLKDQVNLGPGNYKVVVSYFKDTGNGKRPHIIIKKIEFRNPEAASNAK